jgi:sulfate adenylyltransferase subunit 1 (EFTu-like GTPase family)
MASAGQSVGLLLEDPTPVKRGQVGSNVDDAPVATNRFSARVFWISPQSLTVKDKIEVLCGTQSCRGHIERIAKVIDPVSLAAVKTDAARLDDSQVAEIVIRTEWPVCIDPADVVPELGRFALLRDGRIGGGGVIVK